MTEPGASAPESAPQQPPLQPPTAEAPVPETGAAQPWPAEYPASPRAGQPAPPLWLAQQGYAPGPALPAPPRRDSTRTMAIIALVLSVLALAGLALSSIVPLLFFGLFAAVGGDSVDDGSFPSVSTSSGGQVAPGADGSIAGPALASAVTTLVEDDGYAQIDSPLTCDPVPRAADGVSVLCRAEDPSWFGIIRFTGTDGSFDLVAVSPDDLGFGPDGGPFGPNGDPFGSNGGPGD